MNTTQTDQAVAMAGNPPMRSGRQAPGQLVGFCHLLWKEYRSIRLFWVSMVALAIALEWLIATFSQDKSETVNMIFQFALGAPAFFAIGAAGASFAAEKEEGTFGFLRASPVSSGQILASKLLFVALSTAAMFVVLWPIAFLLTSHQLPDAKVLTGMLGLWLVGAVEAVAWGTLFSLLGARPLVAVILAMAAASTGAHLISRCFFELSSNSFELAAYGQAAPWRLLLALLVLGTDVYLGLRWLAGDSAGRSKLKGGRLSFLLGRGQGEGSSFPPKSLAPALWQGESGNQLGTPHPDAEGAGQMPIDLRHLLLRRSRAAMLGRLLWQHWRQSWRLLLLMPVLGGLAVGAVGVAGYMGALGQDARQLAIPLAMSVFASLIGSMVFLTDQEQRRYRFFAEHNVPPRYVWLTRHLFWMLVVFILTLLALWFWLKTTEIGYLWHVFADAFNNRNSWINLRYHGRVDWPPFTAALAMVAVAYAAGQWVSMLVRSGIMSGFLGLFLSAVLCGWALLMHWMQINLLWSVWPIVVVLLFATWLRAPDWISEDKRVKTRLKVAAIVLLPALAIAITMPIYRVDQIPGMSPGFDVDQYETQIKANFVAGQATAELYRDARQQLHGMDLNLDDLPGGNRLDASLQVVVAAHRQEVEAAIKRARDNNEDPPSLWELASRYEAEMYQAPTPVEKKWLDDNAESLQLLVEAAKRPRCIFYDPATATHFQDSSSEQSLQSFVSLMLIAGRQLEVKGQLDEALDHYLLTLPIIADIYSSQPFFLPEREFKPDVRRVFLQIANWAGKPGQTPARLRAALERLQSLKPSLLRMDEFVKNTYILTGRLIQGDAELRQYFYPSDRPEKMRSEMLWATLMPWENDRAFRVLNVLTNSAMYRSRVIDFVLDQQGGHEKYRPGLDQTAAEGWSLGWFPGEIDVLNHKQTPQLYIHELKDWIPTTNPDLSSIERLYQDAAVQTIDFEAQRRGTMLVLAIETYRLEHDKLPQSLADLQGNYLQRWPLDPYSGFEFRYFPHGAPLGGDEEVASTTAFEVWQRYGGPPIKPEQPGVWCTGPTLTASMEEENADYTSEAVNPNATIVTWRYSYRAFWDWPRTVPLREALGAGFWFPLPAAPE